MDLEVSSRNSGTDGAPERPSRLRRGDAWHPIVELTRVRLFEFFREPEAIFWVFAFPVLLALVLGIAFRSRAPETVSVAVVDGRTASAIVDALRSAGGVRVMQVSASDAEAAMRAGRVSLIVVPGDSGEPPTFRYDPTRTESRLTRLVVDAALQRAAGRQNAWDAREQQVTTRGSRYIDWLIPGLLAMNIMGSGLWGLGFTIVTSRTKKLLKRLIATPMRRGHYLMSHVFGRMFFLTLEVVSLVGFAWLVFGIPVQGAFSSLAVICLTGALSFGGLGLLVASRARTIEAVSGLMNVVMLPMWTLSGVFFAYSNFPEVMHRFIRLLPLTALIDALRANMIEGASLAAVRWELLVLAGWGVICFFVALRIFRWR